MKKRFWEVDFLRGIAILMMVMYHSLWNLNHFYNIGVSVSEGFWGAFQVTTASLFLFLAGVSLTISSAGNNTGYAKYLKRGLKIFSFGLIITLVTKLIFPNGFVVFGILHLIGVSIIISYVFRKFGYLNLLFGVGFIAVGALLKGYAVDFDWLFFLGVYSGSFYSLDYFPVFPWFGVILIGMFFGDLLYSNNKRNFKLKDLPENVAARFVCFLGKKSLIIYLLHQIVLYGMFFVVSTIF